MKKAITNSIHEIFKKMTPELREEFLTNKTVQEYVVQKAKNRCWAGYEPTPGKEPYAEGSCKKIKKTDPKQYAKAYKAKKACK